MRTTIKIPARFSRSLPRNVSSLQTTVTANLRLLFWIATNHDEHECFWFHGWSRTRFSSIELSCRQIDGVSRSINIHGPGTFWCWNSLNDCELARGRFAKYVEFAVTAACERLRAIEFRGIDACANREIRQNFPIIGAHYDEPLRISA